MMQEYKNNLLSNMIQEYNNNLLSEDPTANDVELNIYPTTNDVELNTGSTNNERYNLRRKKRDYGKHIGKEDGDDG